MIQSLEKDLKGNHKHLPASGVEFDKGFSTFTDLFESGKSPMFIIDLDTQKYIDVNQEFVHQQKAFEGILVKFEASIQGEKDITPLKFRKQGQTYLFNPVFQTNGRALVQILALDDDKKSCDQKSKKATSTFCENKSLNMVLLDNLPLGLLHTNREFEPVWSNVKCNSLFGRKIDQNFNFVDSIYVKNISKFWSKMEELNQEGRQADFNFSIHNVKKSDEINISATAIAVGEQDQLEEGFIFILEDKTENVHFSEEITKQNLALNQINHELDKFLYSVSHNIRGPIASLQGLLKVIEISDVETVNELKQHLRFNLRLLNGFVSDISKVATNIHTHVTLENVNLRNVLEQAVLFVDTIYNLNPKVSIDIPSNYSIKTDADRFSIILKGLLKNSFQYRDTRKEDFKISIKATQNEDFHLIEITDNGIGIADKVKPFIFDMFYRGTELSNGNGMGLYNTREILKKIGGTMNITSKDREYTTAKLYLPINPA